MAAWRLDFTSPAPILPRLQELAHWLCRPISTAPPARSRPTVPTTKTVFARHEAPSPPPPPAALHPRPRLAALAARGIARETINPHVGAGTFLPLRHDDVAATQHPCRRGEITAAAPPASTPARAAGGPHRRRRHHHPAPAGNRCRRRPAISAPSPADRAVHLPGIGFRGADLLLTNFHLPRSTLFMLVCAFAGRSGCARLCPRHRTGYRFYSYGDASLLEPEPRR